MRLKTAPRGIVECTINNNRIYNMANYIYPPILKLKIETGEGAIQALSLDANKWILEQIRTRESLYLKKSPRFYMREVQGKDGELYIGIWQIPASKPQPFLNKDSNNICEETIRGGYIKRVLESVYYTLHFLGHSQLKDYKRGWRGIKYRAYIYFIGDCIGLQKARYRLFYKVSYMFNTYKTHKSLNKGSI